jgi:hypothetical protein
MGSPSKPITPKWQRAIAIFGLITMLPIYGLMIGIFLISAIPVLLILPLYLFPREPGAPPAPPPVLKPAHHAV